jgi:hypothetical protein
MFKMIFVPILNHLIDIENNLRLSRLNPVARWLAMPTSYHPPSDCNCNSTCCSKDYPLHTSSNANARILLARTRTRARCSTSRLDRSQHTSLYIRRSNRVLYIASSSLVLGESLRTVRTVDDQLAFDPLFGLLARSSVTYGGLITPDIPA